MKKYAIDWAISKRFQIYDIERDETSSLLPTIEVFTNFFDLLDESAIFFLEEGGGDTFKLMALRRGHKVFATLGKKVKELREILQLPESDENSAKTIGLLAKSCPQNFHEYKELDILTLKISLLFREYEKLVKDRTQKKNQLIAICRRLRLLTSETQVEDMIEKREITIAALDKEVFWIYNELRKLLKTHPLWIGYLKDIKGVGPVVAAGIIGSIGRCSRFSSRDSIRCFAGMFSKRGNTSYNRQLKKALGYFADGIVKFKTPVWRELYDNMKGYYKQKHLDWKPGKIDFYARKAVQTKFICKMRKIGCYLESKEY